MDTSTVISSKITAAARVLQAGLEPVHEDILQHTTGVHYIDDIMVISLDEKTLANTLKTLLRHMLTGEGKR